MLGEEGKGRLRCESEDRICMPENEGTAKVQEVACIREGTENEAFGASHLNTLTARV